MSFSSLGSRTSIPTTLKVAQRSPIFLRALNLDSFEAAVMAPTKQTSDQKSFRARLDPSSKAALKVLLMGNDLVDVDHKEGAKLLESASNILSRRRAHSFLRQTALENSRKEEVGKRAQKSAGSQDADTQKTSRASSYTVADDIGKILESGSDEDLKQMTRKLRDFLGFTPELEEVEFSEIDFEDGERQLAEEHRARQIREFDKDHHGHTYFCKGNIWEEVGPDSPYRTMAGDIRKEYRLCDRCGDFWEGKDVWVCDVGLCGILICENCWREYERKRTMVRET